MVMLYQVVFNLMLLLLTFTILKIMLNLLLFSITPSFGTPVFTSIHRPVHKVVYSTNLEGGSPD